MKRLLFSAVLAGGLAPSGMACVQQLNGRPLMAPIFIPRDAPGKTPSMPPPKVQYYGYGPAGSGPHPIRTVPVFPPEVSVPDASAHVPEAPAPHPVQTQRVCRSIRRCMGSVAPVATSPQNGTNLLDPTRR
jgi:hypothetical protein